MRKIVQLTSCASADDGDHYAENLYALCEDGTVWACSPQHSTCSDWWKLPEIPSEDAPVKPSRPAFSIIDGEKSK